jgi:hypothetical protein
MRPGPIRADASVAPIQKIASASPGRCARGSRTHCLVSRSERFETFRPIRRRLGTSGDECAVVANAEPSVREGLLKPLRHHFDLERLQGRVIAQFGSIDQDVGARIAIWIRQDPRTPVVSLDDRLVKFPSGAPPEKVDVDRNRLHAARPPRSARGLRWH